MQRAVTLLEVAKAARVSKTTVSNVFSRPERVRPALRERVAAAARELGYAGPDPKGRVLSSGKVNAIGVVPVGNFGITLFFTHEYDSSFLAGVARTCAERGVGLSLVSGRQDEWSVNDALVDGFISASVEQIDLIEPARRRQLPVVVSGVAGTDISSVTVENRKGAREITRHLLELGHRRFAIASVLWQFRPPVFHRPTGTSRQFAAAGPPLIERMAGISDALAEFGLSLDDMPVMEACATIEEEVAFGINGAAMLLEVAPEATAVIGLTDGVALSVIDQAKKRGLSVPRDLSVVGFDDVAGAMRSEPPLTTVHHSGFDAGRTAARLLLDGGPTQRVVMPVELIVRGSTAPPRTGGRDRTVRK